MKMMTSFKFLFLIITQLTVYNQNQILTTMIETRQNIHNFNHLLQSFATSCFKIVHKHHTKMQILTHDGVQSMQSLFKSYQLDKKKPLNQTQTTKNIPTVSNGCSVKKKEYLVDFLDIGFSEKKPLQASMTKMKSKKQNKEDTMILSEKMTKMNLDCDYLLEDINEDDEQTRKASDINELKKMTIMEIMEASNKKIMQKKRQNGSPEEPESEYDMTDYSSNQSSNENDYDTHYADEDENKPLFGGLWAKGISAQNTNSAGSIFPTLKFSAKQLLKSPKKYPKNKRLFVGRKKVPRWAQDLDKIGKQQEKQTMRDTNDIFGVCVVENLNTNAIFEKKLEISRTSSAKWNPKMFLE